MQQIDPIHNLGYNARGHLLSGKSKRLKVRSIKGKPIDAATFDAVGYRGRKMNHTHGWLLYK